MKYDARSYSLAGWAFRLWLKHKRHFWRPRCSVFAQHDPRSINAIRIINLDRHTSRLTELNHELSSVLDRDGRPLLDSTTRFTAIDALTLGANYDIRDLEAYYSLADQLFVEPDARVPLAVIEGNQHIALTQQEVAVALSHIGVWKAVASGDDDHVLVLEDDIYFGFGFVKKLSHAWATLDGTLDILYLSYQAGRSGIQLLEDLDSVFRPRTGLWQLSGYVLSRGGAEKLLDKLPVRGPVDLWMNLQFESMNVFATQKPIIHQRPDNVSSNSYSILPILSKVGLLDGGTSLFEPQDLRSPVFVFGAPGSGLSAVAMALSLLGYRCCSDLEELCPAELEKLRSGYLDRAFNAYVNIGSLRSDLLSELAKTYPRACFVLTGPTSECEYACLRNGELDGRLLELDVEGTTPWKQLCKFLECNLPVCEFPRIADVGMQRTRVRPRSNLSEVHQSFDVSPWVLPHDCWPETCPVVGEGNSFSRFFESDFAGQFDSEHWQLLHETFPSNLAYFQPSNLVQKKEWSDLCLREEDVALRAYTSASIASRQAYRFGRFTATLKASSVSGVVTGVFLHRNCPGQEIDIEIIGKDPTRMLTNVFFNPGVEGTKYDYGYRGTPIIVDLGFDASLEFHEFTIEWQQDCIRWFVDGDLLHERVNWAPTPIPSLPMRFYVNIWPSSSREFAGPLDRSRLPTDCALRNVRVQTNT